MKGNDGFGDNEWTDRAGGNRAGERFFQFIIDHLGPWSAYGVLFFASVQYLLFDRKSTDAIRDFRTHCGLPMGPVSLFRHFYSFGVTLIDRYCYLSGKKNRLSYTCQNEELIEREYNRGKGVILLGAHIGNWDYAGNLLSDHIDIPAHVFMYHAGRNSSEKEVKAGRNLTLHYVDENSADTVVAIVNILRRGEIVCMHGDRFTGTQRRVRVNFFNEPASFPAGPMAIAGTTGAPVLPFFSVRTGMGTYSIASTAEPIYVDFSLRSEREERIRGAMKQFVSGLEAVCRRYPEQWYNFYRFWNGE